MKRRRRRTLAALAEVRIVGATVALICCSCTSAAVRDAPRWAALTRPCSADAPAFSVSDSARATLRPSADSAINLNARWAGVARRVPGGWGGFALEDGVLTLYLVDPSRRAAAIAAINEHGVDGRTLSADVRVRRVRWDFAQLYDWYQFLTPRIAGRGVVSAGIDVTGNRLVYGVTTEADVRQLESRLATLNVPCLLVAMREGERIRLTGARPSEERKR